MLEHATIPIGTLRARNFYIRSSLLAMISVCNNSTKSEFVILGSDRDTARPFVLTVLHTISHL